MEITLKNLKVAKFMSQDTLCYQATIYVDGKKAGTVENEGHGGCSNVHLNPEFRHLNDQKFPLPCGCLEMPEMGDKCVICKGTGIWNHSFDEYCNHLAYELNNAKERTKLLNKYRKQGFKFVVDFNGGFVAVNAVDEKSARTLIQRKYPTYTITAIITL